MSKKRNEYIDQLLSDLKLLEERLLSVKESDTLPFSFFSASFDRIERISRSLHELELMQIGEMKEQMERLVRFLSESDGRGNVVGEPEISSTEGAEEDILENKEEIPGNGPEIMEAPVDQPLIQPEYSDSQEYPSTGTDDMGIEQERTRFTERIILPEYRDPRISEATPPSSGERQAFSEKNRQEKTVTRSLNDTIQVSPALVDLKKRISLNDRFLFQRELFNNNRAEMNRVMEKLNTLGSFGEAEDYLRSEQNWNFENQTVKEFLLIIKKGFE